MPQAPSFTDSPSRSRITHAIAPELSAIPDGTYRAHQNGHEVRLKVPGVNMLLFSEREITGDWSCVVEANDGVVVVRGYAESDFKKEST